MNVWFLGVWMVRVHVVVDTAVMQQCGGTRVFGQMGCCWTVKSASWVGAGLLCGNVRFDRVTNVACAFWGERICGFVGCWETGALWLGADVARSLWWHGACGGTIQTQSLSSTFVFFLPPPLFSVLHTVL